MNINENQWTSMKINEHQWNYNENQWKSNENQWNLMKIKENQWTSMKKQWKSMNNNEINENQCKSFIKLDFELWDPSKSKLFPLFFCCSGVDLVTFPSLETDQVK